MAYIGHSPSTGEDNNFKILDDISSYTLTFDGSSSSVVSTSDETIYSYNHRFVQGQRVTYNNGGGGNIAGLTSGTVYFIIKEDHNNIKLATSASNAQSGTAVNITAVGSGASHTLNVAFDGVNTKFKATHTTGKKARITRSAQLVLSVNGVIQQPHDSSSPSTGFGFDLDGTIVFSQAPASTDVFWGHILTNNNVTFDISDNTVDHFSGDGSTVAFTLSKSPPNNENILVTIDGVVQYPNDGAGNIRSYSVVANVINFTTAPGSGTQIEVRHIGFAGATTGSGGGGVTGVYGRTGNVVLIDSDNITVNDAAITGNATVSGNTTITGDLTVNGTTTTLDTKLTEVDQLLVAANNSTVAVAVTQSGAGDILQLFDGTSKVIAIDDTGKIGIGTAVPQSLIHTQASTSNGLMMQTPLGEHYIWGIQAAGNLINGSTAGDLGIRGKSGISISGNNGTATQVRIDSSGRLLVGHTSTIDTSTYNSKLQVMADDAEASITVGRFGNNASATALNFSKSRGADVGSHTSGDLHDNDVIGNIFWWGSDGSDYEEAARISVNAGAAYTSGGTPGELTFWTTASGATTATERIRIHHDGKLSVGTASAGYGQWSFVNLGSSGADATGGETGLTIRSDEGFTNTDVTGSDNWTLKLRNNAYAGSGVSGAQGTVSKILFSAVTSNGHNSFVNIGCDTQGTGGSRGDFFVVTGGGSEALRIKSTGNVGINSTSPDRRFTIQQDATCRMNLKSLSNSTAGIEFGDEVDHNAGYIVYDNTNHSMQVGVGTGEKLRITSTGHIVTQGLTSYTFNNDSANTKIFEVTGDGTVGEYGVINISGNQTADDGTLGIIKFINRENSASSSGSGSGSKQVGSIEMRVETTDSNAGDDCGGYMRFITKGDGSGNAERLRINSSGKVRVGSGNPTYNLEVQTSGFVETLIGSTNAGGAGIILDGDANGDGSGGDYAQIFHDTSGDMNYRARGGSGASNHIFLSGTGEKLRIDSDGRLIVGRAGTDPTEVRMTLQGNSASATSYTVLDLRRGEAADAIGDVLGYIRFTDTNVTSSNENYALIYAQVDKASTDASDNPGRLVFATTRDGASGPTKALMIDSDGKFHTGEPATNAIDDFNITATGTGATLSLNRAKTGNASDDDLLGAISFQSYPAGQGYAAAEAAIRSYAETGQSGSAAPTDLRFYTKPSTTGPGASPNERLRISSNGDTRITSGKLGVNCPVGETVPAALTVRNGGIYLEQSTGYITWNNGDNYIKGESGYHLLFQTYNGSSNTDKLRIRGGSGITNNKIQLPQLSGGFYHSHNSAAITPANNDWVYFGYVSYGSGQRSQFVVEWASLNAPSCCYHGYAILEAGSSHGPDYDYVHSESMELLAYDSHGAHNFKAWKLVDSSSSGGSHLKIFGQWSGSTVSSGTFHMTVLPGKTMLGQAVQGANPAVDNNSYNGTRLTIDGRFQRGSTGFEPQQLRLNKSMFGIFHASSGLDTAGAVSTRGSAAGADGTIWCNYGGLSATRNSGVVGSFTPFAGMVAPNGAGARYLHVKFNIVGGSMWLMEIMGYEYNGNWTSSDGSSTSTDKIHHSIAGGYHYNSNALFNGKSSAYRGIAPGWYLNDNYVCCYIDTNSTGTSNRWGFYKFAGGTDGIIGVGNQRPVCVLAYTYSTGTGDAF